MTIAFLVLGETMPSTRFRVLQYLPYLDAANVRWTVLQGAPRRTPRTPARVRTVGLYARALLAARCHDIVFLQKPGFATRRWGVLRLLFRLNRRVVFDFDDALFVDPRTGGTVASDQLDRLTYTIAHSAAVVAGNPYLADFARRYRAGVEVVPTPVDCERYVPAAATSAGRPVTIGWMGTAPNLGYLERLLPAVRRVLQQADARLVVVCNLLVPPPPLRGDERIAYQLWREEAEVEQLQAFDIGIMPLDDDPFTRGKCGFKLLQYMAVGRPAVASPVGANAGIVLDGVTGFLAASHDDWAERLLRLCRDPHLRQTMGAAGRDRAVREYSLRRTAPGWIRLLQGVGQPC